MSIVQPRGFVCDNINGVYYRDSFIALVKISNFCIKFFRIMLAIYPQQYRLLEVVWAFGLYHIKLQGEGGLL